MIKKFIENFIYRIRGEYTIDKLVKLGLKVGQNFNPQLGFELDPSHCWLIEIGNDVTFGPHVQVLAHDASTCKYIGYAKIGRVNIGNNVFVGAGSIILPGVSIGDNVIIGAGSVVCKSIASGFVAAGNPAKEISTVDDYIRKHKIAMSNSPKYGNEFTLRENVTEVMKKKQKSELKDKMGYIK